jgi:hydroxymethylbilane synthase
LAVECRVNDNFVLELLSKLCDFKTQCRILTERSFLKTLGGGCSAPVGINSVVEMNGKKFTMKVDGGVWSLNGKTEIVDKISESFVVENGSEDDKEESDDDDLDVSPSKRPKMSEEEQEKLKKSPEIIDESSSSMGGKNATELVNIHGKMFNVCPYSGKTLNEAKNEETAAGCPFDPVKMPIGSDFMGECPVLNTAQKITFDTTTEMGGGDGLKCPMTGKMFIPPTNEEIDKCPFMHKQHVELIDYEANALKEPKCNPKSLIENIDECRLYCGFFCHKESLRPAFDKCEALGVSLAKKLIAAGALEVMKVAQDEIHSKC